MFLRNEQPRFSVKAIRKASTHLTEKGKLLSHQHTNELLLFNLIRSHLLSYYFPRHSTFALEQ